MAYKAHRHGDSRQCGATTIVEGQGSCYVNSRLWAVNNDPNSHGEGRLIASGTTLFINNKPIIVHAPDKATPDLADHPAPPTDTAEGSGNTFAY